jgi:hypothetical protein
MSGLAVPFPRIVFSARIAWACPHAKQCLKRAQNCGEERRDAVFLIQTKTASFTFRNLACAHEIPRRPRPSVSARSTGLVKRFWATPDFVHHVQHWRSLSI